MLSTVQFNAGCKSCKVNATELLSPFFTRKLIDYYQSIDKEDYRVLPRLFDERAIYNRHGWDEFYGLPAIIDFFKNKRLLRGQHTILKMGPATPQNMQNQRWQEALPVGVKVRVNGIFTGKIQNRPIQLQFQDLWIFNPKTHKVVFRQTLIKPNC